MMTVLILAAGQRAQDVGAEGYPLCLTEFEGTSLLERLVRSCRTLGDVKIIVELRADEIQQFHLHDVVSLIDPSITVLGIESETRGAPCSALLAVEHFEPDDELLILNGNEVLDVDFRASVEQFREWGVAAGTLTFPSIHPRYSYVRTDENGRVLEAAEKRPISRSATMGFYWYKSAQAFVSAAEELIRTSDTVDDRFYVSHTLNHLILQGLDVGHVHHSADQFHPLKTNRQLEAYERETSQ